MDNRHAANIQRMINAVLTSPGETDPALRRAVEERSAQLGGRPTAQVGHIPPELTGSPSLRVTEGDARTLDLAPSELAQHHSTPAPTELSPARMESQLTTYVDKVAQHAYKTTDEDIEALRKAGYSEDAIFEITLSTALGAGIARLERGLAALKGDE